MPTFDCKGLTLIKLALQHPIRANGGAPLQRNGYFMKRKYLVGSALAIGLLASVSAMAANTAPMNGKATPPTKIVDAQGTLVGYVQAGTLLVLLNNTWVYLGNSFTSAGITPVIGAAGPPWNTYYQSTDCSGNVGYMDVSTLPGIGFLIGDPSAPVNSGGVIFPSPNAALTAVNSYRQSGAPYCYPTTDHRVVAPENSATFGPFVLPLTPQ
ncbi:MAG TPA: hypothetical protein VGH47_13815 [Xanthobacteraceae bacterium]|jgi:hypothetical protein